MSVRHGKETSTDRMQLEKNHGFVDAGRLGRLTNLSHLAKASSRHGSRCYVEVEALDGALDWTRPRRGRCIKCAQ